MQSFEPMNFALELARSAFLGGEVPVGAVILDQNKIVAGAHNGMRDGACVIPPPLLHAEIIAMAKACQTLGTQRLDQCSLFVTLEPCALCASAIALMRIQHVFFGAYDPKGGGVVHGGQIFDHALHRPEVIGGVMEKACSSLIQDFFQKKR